MRSILPACMALVVGGMALALLRLYPPWECTDSGEPCIQVVTIVHASLARRPEPTGNVEDGARVKRADGLLAVECAVVGVVTLVCAWLLLPRSWHFKNRSWSNSN